MSPPTAKRELLVVGSGTMFISGISHYTRYLAEALAERVPVSVLLMRRLIPRALYPGRARVGAALTDARYPPMMPVYDGVDWYWLPSMFRGLFFLWRRRPATVIFQWWTGAVLHSYLLLALAARLGGAHIVVELHEIQDTGEAKMALAARYVDRLGRRFMQMADAFVVHSEFDRRALRDSFGDSRQPVKVVRHGPYSHYESSASGAPLREAPAAACNFFFFGTIRPYKGLEDLVGAFEEICDDGALEDYWLTIVGETWEDWNKPLELIAASRFRDRITLVNRYVSDADASRWFAGADVVVLPYRRSSASGPLHIAMGAGLPVVVTDVGGLGEATSNYEGAVMVAAMDQASLHQGMRVARDLRGRRFDDQVSWGQTADAMLELIDELKPSN